jgi:hypothetical protein
MAGLVPAIFVFAGWGKGAGRTNTGRQTTICDKPHNDT